MYSVYYAVFCWPMTKFDKMREIFEAWIAPYLDLVPVWVEPNNLCYLRMALTVPICYLLFWKQSFLMLAFLLYLVACLTDFFDGALSRRREISTEFGKILDPVADKILHCSIFICYLYFFEPSFLLKVTIAVVIGADLVTLLLGLGVLFFIRKISIGSNCYGKIKFGFQCAGVICLISGWSLASLALPIAAAMGTLSATSYFLAAVYR